MDGWRRRRWLKERSYEVLEESEEGGLWRKDDGGRLQVNIQYHSLSDKQSVSLVALQPSQRESRGANGGGRSRDICSKR